VRHRQQAGDAGVDIIEELTERKIVLDRDARLIGPWPAPER
jgi:hypothetical protein